jgi:hypothetical protein
MVGIEDCPLEVLARIFEEMDLESAWNAREVSRHWRRVFEFCAFNSHSIYLRGVCVNIDVICGIFSPKGKLLDQHIIQGQLSNLRSGPSDIFEWVSNNDCYEIWPGGKWRKHNISDVVTDVALRISNPSVTTTDVFLRLGKQASIRTNYCDSISQRPGKFGAFVVMIKPLKESLSCGRSYDKHSIDGLFMPMWQIYSLLVHNTKAQNSKTELLYRHFAQHSTYDGTLGPQGMDDLNMDGFHSVLFED